MVLGKTYNITGASGQFHSVFKRILSFPCYRSSYASRYQTDESVFSGNDELKTLFTQFLFITAAETSIGTITWRQFCVS